MDCIIIYKMRPAFISNVRPQQALKFNSYVGNLFVRVLYLTPLTVASISKLLTACTNSFLLMI